MGAQALLEAPHTAPMLMTLTVKPSMPSMRMALQPCSPRLRRPHMAGQVGVRMGVVVALGRLWAPPLPTPMPLLLRLSLHAHR